MAEINVSIAGRQYRMACDDGEEARLESLAKRLDAKIAELRRHFGEIGDQRITIMAALTMTDDLDESERRIRQLEDTIQGTKDSDMAHQADIEALSDAVAGSLAALSGRIERIARSLEDTASRG